MKKRILALSLTVLMSVSMLLCCPASKAESAYTYADTIAWDGQYDVVVIGFGGAGATAAATAADEGASVLLVEKAPEGHEGGNTRYCGQLFVYGDEDEEATYQYYKTLMADHEIPEAMMRVYTNNVAHMYDVVERLTGIPKDQYIDWTGTALAGSISPEYPEFPGSEHISLNTLHQGFSDGYLWKALREQVTKRADSIDVWFESPAVRLIQDPASKTILGVQVVRSGKTLNIRAINGVVMAMGGFENNPEMMADYTGLTNYNPAGGLYNTGDGIKMVLEVGADLWHMESYEGMGFLGGSCIAVPKGERGINFSTNAYAFGPSLMISGDGTRLVREDESSRHGHVKNGDGWHNIRYPQKAYAICTTEHYDAAGTAATYANSTTYVYQAETIAELAKLINVNPETLTATVERFNEYARNGYDHEFGRSATSMAPIEGNSFTAVEVRFSLLNTQGGPRRNENAEVLDTDGNPIPHLYSAGEFGGITAFQYQGGGNVSECFIFGEIAGKNAAAVKEALPAYEARQQVTSSMTYTLGTESDLAANGPDVVLGENEYLGMSPNGIGGNLYVKVTMDGAKIAAVEIVEHHETDGISDPARNQITGMIVAANSTEVDNISGATITSKAIKEAVDAALAQVK